MSVVILSRLSIKENIYGTICHKYLVIERTQTIMVANDHCQTHLNRQLITQLCSPLFIRWWEILHGCGKSCMDGGKSCLDGGKCCMDEATNNFADLFSTTLPTNLIASINPKMWSMNILWASFRLACYAANLDSNGLLTLVFLCLDQIAALEL